jgi:hypothetical protein
MFSIIINIGLLFMLSGCATIVNDSNIPLNFSFSDGTTGHCVFMNKRGTWESDMPASNVLIRRSDDVLIYNCETKDGQLISGSVKSEIEGGKLAASVFLLDFGITDAITDKHRKYQNNTIINITPKTPE